MSVLGYPSAVGKMHDAWTYVFAVDMRTGEVLRDVRVDGHYRNALRHVGRLGARELCGFLWEHVTRTIPQLEPAPSAQGA